MPAADPKLGRRPHGRMSVRTNLVRVRVSSGPCAPSASAISRAGPAPLQLSNPVRNHQAALTLPTRNTVRVLRTPPREP